MDEQNDDLEVPCTDQQPHRNHRLSPVAHCPGRGSTLTTDLRVGVQATPDLREPGDDWDHPVDHRPPVDGTPVPGEYDAARAYTRIRQLDRTNQDLADRLTQAERGRDEALAKAAAWEASCEGLQVQLGTAHAELDQLTLETVANEKTIQDLVSHNDRLRGRLEQARRDIKTWQDGANEGPEYYMGKTAQTWCEAHNRLEVNLSQAQLMVVALKTELSQQREANEQQWRRHAETCPQLDPPGDIGDYRQQIDRWLDARPTDSDGWTPMVVLDPHLAQAVTKFLSDLAGEATPVQAEPQPRNETFGDWWQSHVQTLQLVHRKAEEYGSNSLAQIGRMYARARGRDVIEDPEALEIGCAVYAYGKMERVMDALLRDRLPSIDTWYDLMIYAAMAQYIRTNRRWP